MKKELTEDFLKSNENCNVGDGQSIPAKKCYEEPERDCDINCERNSCGVYKYCFMN